MFVLLSETDPFILCFVCLFCFLVTLSISSAFFMAVHVLCPIITYSCHNVAVKEHELCSPTYLKRVRQLSLTPLCKWLSWPQVAHPLGENRDSAHLIAVLV